MNAIRTVSKFLIIIIITLMPMAMSLAQISEEDQAIAIAASHEDFITFLADIEGWEAEAYEEEGAWIVEFFIEGEDDEEGEWLGFVVMSLETGEVYEAFSAAPLPTEVETRLQAQVLALVQDDDEMMARLDNNPAIWEEYVEYDRYEQLWYVAYFRGLDAWAAVVEVGFEDDTYNVEYMTITDVVNPHRMEEEEEQANRKNEAIGLAYESDGIEAALAGIDDWTTLVSEQSDGTYGVQFISDGQVRFFALVDVDTWTIHSSE